MLCRSRGWPVRTFSRWQRAAAIPSPSMAAAAVCTPYRGISRKEIESKMPGHIKANPHEKVPSNVDDAPEVSREALSKGINGIYGNRAESAMRGMLGPQGQVEAMESRAVPILGKATVDGTKYTVDRSTVFEHWRHECPAPVGWHLSKLGSATCKVANDVNEATESLQLQIIKGCNVIEIDGAASEAHQSISRSIYEALHAFELDREGFVVVARCGIIRQQPFQEEITGVQVSNTAAVKSRILPIFERYKASSIPSMQLKSGFRISDMNEEQLRRLHLRRVDRTTVAALTVDWLDAFFTNVAFNTKFEVLDVMLLEGIHTLFDGRPDAHVDDDIAQLFAYLEKQVEIGVLQYYGVSSLHLAPPVQRDYPQMPPDAHVPEQFRHPPKVPDTINLYRLLALAERAGGKNHHFRFVEYPFNLTNHQAISTPLPYDASHTLYSLTKKMGLTAFGASPIEATNLMQLPERYHSFPMESDLKSVRMNFFTICERSALKEMEVKEAFEKGPATLPPMEHLFVSSVYLNAQRQFNNLFFFKKWMDYYMLPRFGRALTSFKEASPQDLKEWAQQYEQLVFDLLRLRERLFNHKHGVKSTEINWAIDRASRTLATCPLLNQKAINFATYGADVVVCGFHVSRYFHEATELNPAKNGELPVPMEEIQALYSSPEVSFANASPPHPYMLEPVVKQGKLSKQKPKAMEDVIVIDTKNPKFPDIPEELEDNADDEEKTEGQEETEGAAAEKEKDAEKQVQSTQ